MDGICRRIKDGEPFVLTKGADDVCAACPFCKDGECMTKEKTDRYDKAALEILSLEYGREYTYKDFEKTDIIDKVCHGCEWYGLCKEQKNSLCEFFISC